MIETVISLGGARYATLELKLSAGRQRVLCRFSFKIQRNGLTEIMEVSLQGYHRVRHI